MPTEREAAATPDTPDTPETADAAQERPPLGSWPRLYAVVLAELALLILLFTLFARAFR